MLVIRSQLMKNLSPKSTYLFISSCAVNRVVQVLSLVLIMGLQESQYDLLEMTAQLRLQILLKRLAVHGEVLLLDELSLLIAMTDDVFDDSFLVRSNSYLPSKPFINQLNPAHPPSCQLKLEILTFHGSFEALGRFLGRHIGESRSCNH